MHLADKIEQHRISARAGDLRLIQVKGQQKNHMGGESQVRQRLAKALASTPGKFSPTLSSRRSISSSSRVRNRIPHRYTLLFGRRLSFGELLRLFVYRFGVVLAAGVISALVFMLMRLWGIR